MAQPATEIPEDDRRNLLYRAIDQHGKVSDVLAGDKRDLTATRRLFTRMLAHARHPVEVTTDRAPASLRVLDELLPAACHVKEHYANNAIKKRSWAIEGTAATDARS